MPRTPHNRLEATAPALALAALTALGPCAANAFDKGPYVQNVDTRQATIMWSSASNESAKVTVRKPGKNKDIARVLVPSTNCAPIWEATINGLQTGEHYVYTVEQGADRAEGELQMAPRAGKPFSAAIYGDNRSDPRAHAAIVDRVVQDDPDFMVHTGDLVVAGSLEADWQSFFQVAQPLLRNRPLFPIAGNHEQAGDDEIERFRQYFHLPNGEYYFGFTWGNLRFLAIDVNVRADAGMPDAAQTAWLVDQVRRAERDPAITHTIAFLHQGPFSSNPVRTGNLGVRELVHRLYDLGLDLLVSGHDHYYERGRAAYGLNYMVVGSGGAPLYPTRGPGDYGAYQAFQSISQHAFVRLRSTGRAVSMCAVNLDGVAFDCFDLPQNRGVARP